MADLSFLTDDERVALKNGDFSKISTESLVKLKGDASLQPVKSRQFGVSLSPSEARAISRDRLAKQIIPNEQIEGMVRGANLPLLGAILGGFTGGVGSGVPTLGVGTVGGATVGAGLGGASGKALENALLGLYANRQTPLKQGLQDTAIAGIEGSTAELGGQAIGPALRLAGKGISKVPGVQRAGQFLKRQAGYLAEGLGTSALPQTQREVAEAVSKGKDTLGLETAKRGIYGFKRKVLDFAKAGRDRFGDSLDELLSSSDRTINPETIVKGLEDLKADFLKTGDDFAVKQIEEKAAKWLDTMMTNQKAAFIGPDEAIKNGVLNLQQANLLKRMFGKQAKSFFRKESADAMAAVNAEFANAMRSTLKKEIEKIVPGVKFANKEFRFYDDLVDALSGELAKDLRQGVIKIKNPLTTAGVSSAGFGAAGLSGAAVGAGAVQVARTFPVKTYLAAQLSKVAGEGVKKAAPEVTANLMSHPTFRNAIFRAATRATIVNEQKKAFNKFGNAKVLTLQNEEGN